jgi:Ca2+-binding EF-hand superfamily protein
MIHKAVAMIAASFVISTISTAALAASKRTTAAAHRDVRTLVRMMDKDQNGSVSKDEFMEFMGREFDRLDVDKNGSLQAAELRPMMHPSWPASRSACQYYGGCSGN